MPITAYCPCRSRSFRALLDAVDRVFGGAAEDREDRHLAQAGNPVIAPFARSHHATVKPEDHAKLGAMERHLFGRCGRGAGWLDMHHH